MGHVAGRPRRHPLQRRLHSMHAFPSSCGRLLLELHRRPGHLLLLLLCHVRLLVHVLLVLHLLLLRRVAGRRGYLLIALAHHRLLLELVLLQHLLVLIGGLPLLLGQVLLVVVHWTEFRGCDVFGLVAPVLELINTDGLESTSGCNDQTER